MNERFKKTLTLDIVDGEASARLAQALETTRSRGGAMHMMRDWLIAGFVLAEMGDGIVEYIRAQDRNPAIRKLSKKERMQDLLRFIDRCNFDYEDYPVQKPTPAKKTEPQVTQGETVKPDKKKERRRQNHLA